MSRYPHRPHGHTWDRRGHKSDAEFHSNFHRPIRYEGNWDPNRYYRPQNEGNYQANQFEAEWDEARRKRSVSEDKYWQYMRDLFPHDDYHHDDNKEDFHGRELAHAGEYPHMAAIGFRTQEGKTDYKCGGSLISENFVVTAAHCTNFNGEAPHVVKIGDINLRIREEDVIPQRRHIRRIHVHPKYKDDSYYNDIALLELSRDVYFTEFVRPIRLWTKKQIPFDTAYAMGYGSTEFGRHQTNILTEMNVTIVSNEDCNKMMPPLVETQDGIVQSQICAYDFKNHRDTCQGDSGGPLQLNLWYGRQRVRQHYFLIGITSYGIFCRSQYPSVSTRISSYVDWIENIVWPEDDDEEDESPVFS